MRTREDIVTELANSQRVERLVATICKGAAKRDREDLSQIVYLSLLHTDEDLLRRLEANGEMDYYLTRIVKNQYQSVTSPYARKICGFRRRSLPLKP